MNIHTLLRDPTHSRTIPEPFRWFITLVSRFFRKWLVPSIVIQNLEPQLENWKNVFHIMLEYRSHIYTVCRVRGWNGSEYSQILLEKFMQFSFFFAWPGARFFIYDMNLARFFLDRNHSGASTKMHLKLTQKFKRQREC